MSATVATLKKSHRSGVVLGLAVALVVVAFMVVLGLRLGVSLGTRSDVLRAGMPAPDITLSLSNGETVSLAQLRGQPVWLTFWATWCPPCRVEMPDLQQVYQASQPGRYRYIAVNFGEDSAAVQGYLQGINYRLPVALDSAGEAALAYRVKALPVHFFIDEQGILKGIYPGVMSRAEMERRVAVRW